MANTRVVLTSAISLVGTIVVSAQIGTAGQQAATSNTTTGGSVTVTGRLQGGTGSTTGTTVTARPGGGSAAATRSHQPGRHVGHLEDRRRAAPPGAAGATGALAVQALPIPVDSRTASSNSQNSTRVPARHSDGFDTELAQHVGHRIEVTGTLTSPAPSTADARPAREPNPATPGAAPSGRTDASGSASSVPQRVQVTGVRMIASTCSGR